MPLDDLDLRLLEVDDGVIEGELLADGRAIASFMANVAVADGVALISHLHLDGAGPNSLGVTRLQRAMAWLLAELDVDEIIIDGGQRVTGAAQGVAGTGPRTPSRLSFKRKLP